MAAAGVAHEAHHTSDQPIGWRRYLYSTNHKDIGTMYLVFALVAGIIGGALSIGMRMELQQPGLQIFPNSHAYDVFTTAHGLIIINQGDAFLGMAPINWVKLVLTYCVPYAVCTYGAVSYQLRRAHPPAEPGT
jgi:heme/copper-type cytochrome/quinol oxidase subunit 1